MARWRYDINAIINALELIDTACGIIEDGGGCENCPLRWNCIDETSFAEIAQSVPQSNIEEMLDFAADIEDYGNFQEYADEMKRQDQEVIDEWARTARQ